MTVYNETGKFVTRIYLSSRLRLVKYNKNILPEQQLVSCVKYPSPD